MPTDTGIDKDVRGLQPAHPHIAEPGQAIQMYRVVSASTYRMASREGTHIFQQAQWVSLLLLLEPVPHGLGAWVNVGLAMLTA